MATKKTTTNTSETPIIMQYKNLKEKHPDALLLFRCGDFYETYYQDAEDAAKILGITLTRRASDTGKPKEEQTPMAGFPYHALDTYLPKLIRAGKRVAICDQIEAQPKAFAKRGVTQVQPGDIEPEVAEEAEQPKEKQPEDMTIAELMAAYKALKEENEQLKMDNGASSISYQALNERYEKECKKAVHWFEKYQEADKRMRKVFEAIAGYEFETK